MSKPWQPHARHILDAIARIRRIQMRGEVHSSLGEIDPTTVAAVIEKHLPALEASIRAMLDDAG